MRLEELLTIISKKTGEHVNQSMLADALNITRQTVSNRIKNESQVTVSELQKIEELEQQARGLYNTGLADDEDHAAILQGLDKFFKSKGWELKD